MTALLFPPPLHSRKEESQELSKDNPGCLSSESLREADWVRPCPDISLPFLFLSPDPALLLKSGLQRNCQGGDRVLSFPLSPCRTP